MSDTANPLHTATTTEFHQTNLSADRIESILNDFRSWLQALSAPPRLPDLPSEKVDLQTLVGHFIALRQEVNLQTKASRTALEQNAQSLQQLVQAQEILQQQPKSSNEETFKPLLKAIVEVYDALSLASKQVEKNRQTLDGYFDALRQTMEFDLLPPVSASLPNVQETIPFWGRLFRKQSAPIPNPLFEERMALDKWRERMRHRLEERQTLTQQTIDSLEKSLVALLNGYTMSLNRLERLLPLFDLEAIPTQGQPFDPEIMEVVEVASNTDQSPGTVIEEMRRGYYWKGKIFRYAQVRVAK